MATSQSIRVFLKDLASSAPTPGGGAASALAAALGAASIEKICRIAGRNPRLKSYHRNLRRLQHQTQSLRRTFERLSHQDQQAYRRVIEAIRHARGSSGKKTFHASIQTALKKAAAPPLALCENSLKMMGLLQRFPSELPSHLWSDIGAGLLLLHAAFQSGAFFVRTNLENVQNTAFTRKTFQRLTSLERKAKNLFGKVLPPIKVRLHAR